MWSAMLPVAALAAVVSGIPCEEAQLKCAYRDGCGTALKNYMIRCSGILQGQGMNYCPQVCEYSLIALISTEEGKALMECDCSDPYCEQQKQRSDICKPSVMKTINEPVVPCNVAQWICNADAECYTAFGFYQLNCKSMFHGKKCTPKCQNSINILRRQEKAQKLKMCKCDGTEDYPCRVIQRNMDKLCFHSMHHHYNGSHKKVHMQFDDTNNTPQVIMTASSARVDVPNLLAACFATLLVLWTR